MAEKLRKKSPSGALSVTQLSFILSKSILPIWTFDSC